MSPDAYWIVPPPAGPIFQTELLSNVVEWRVKIETIVASAATVQVEEFIHPLAIVMTQDCDVALDHKARYEAGAEHRQIDSILLCEVDAAAVMRERGERLDSKRWRQVESNQNERYHVLQAVPAIIAECHSLPAEAVGGAGGDTVAMERAPRGWRRWLACLSRARPTPTRPAVVEPGHVALDPQFRGNLGLDFRRIFTMPTPEVYRRIEIGEAHRHCYLSPVHRDHLSNRFYGYHMRVALEERDE